MYSNLTILVEIFDESSANTEHCSWIDGKIYQCQAQAMIYPGPSKQPVSSLSISGQSMTTLSRAQAPVMTIFSSLAEFYQIR